MSVNLSAAEYPAHYRSWNCSNTEYSCQSPWGFTSLGKPSLADLVYSACRGSGKTAFVQYSRPNDDTPAGHNPVVFLQKAVGVEKARALLERDENNQYKLRSELLAVVDQFIKKESSFYEVYAMTFGVGVSHKRYNRLGKNYRRVVIYNVLEASSGRYENSPELNGFLSKLQIQGQPKERIFYKTHYQNGASPQSTLEKKMGTLSTAVSNTYELEENQEYHLDLSIVSPSGNAFSSCKMSFSVPLDQRTKIYCERHKFPPLIRTRSNIASLPAESIRYAKPPLGGTCVNEYYADKGLSDNSLMGAVFRNHGKCLSCHSGSMERPNPRAGGLLCPKPPFINAGEESTRGIPKHPTLTSHLVRRYFEEPTLANVPKASRGMKRHLDHLKDAYCSEKVITVQEKGISSQKKVRDIFEAWVKNHDNPNTLDFDRVCR